MRNLSLYKLLCSKHIFFFSVLGIGFVVLDSTFLQINQAPRLLLQEFIQLTLIAATVEELIFRGFLQKIILKKSDFLCKTFGPISLANLLTSIVFALSHFIYYQDNTALLTFFPSLVFGYLLDRDNSIVPSIFMHMLYNAAYFMPSLLLAKGIATP